MRIKPHVFINKLSVKMQEAQVNRAVICSVNSPFLTSGSLQSGPRLANMGTETNKEDRNTPEYLAQLLKDKKQIAAFPNVFLHMERLLDDGECSLFISTHPGRASDTWVWGLFWG